MLIRIFNRDNCLSVNAWQNDRRRVRLKRIRSELAIISHSVSHPDLQPSHTNTRAPSKSLSPLNCNPRSFFPDWIWGLISGEAERQKATASGRGNSEKCVGGRRPFTSESEENEPDLISLCGFACTAENELGFNANLSYILYWQIPDFSAHEITVYSRDCRQIVWPLLNTTIFPKNSMSLYNKITERIQMEILIWK